MTDCAPFWGVEPAPLAAAGFLLGVLAHAARPLEATPVWALAFVVLPAAAIWIVGTRQRRAQNQRGGRVRDYRAMKRSLSILLFAFALGLFRFDATLPLPDDPFMEARGRDVSFIARVADVRSYDATLQPISLNGRAVRSRGRVILPRGHGFPNAGETWTVSCRIESAIKTDEETGAASKTALFNARDGAFFACKGSVSARKTADAAWWDPRTLLAALRRAMTEKIARIFPGDEGALLSGILYGERGLSKEASDAFRFAGMTHIIAVSGSNVTIVVVCLVPVFLALGYRRRFAILLSIAGILAFVLFVGASASVVRAAIMGSLALFARAVGRRARPWRLILLAGALLVAWRPWTLAFDAGFALSFLATAGLVAWSTPMARALAFIPERFSLRDAAATTTAATIATFPYQLWAFSSSSLAGLLTNLAALPFIGATMGLGATAVVLGEAIPVAALPASGLLSFMLAVARVSERFPFLLVPIPLSTVGLFTAYGALAFIYWRYSAKKMNYPQKWKKFFAPFAE